MIATPGHTPASSSYKIGDAVFVGDTLFMPDYGTARADFPGGDARDALPLDPQAAGAAARRRGCSCATTTCRGAATQYAWETTVGEERARNVHVHDGVSEDEFVAMREARDATLAAPVLLMPSIQVNMRAGKLPPADANGVHYLRVPVKLAG